MKDNDRKRKEKAADRNATADQKEEKAAKAKFKETQGWRPYIFDLRKCRH